MQRMFVYSAVGGGGKSYYISLGECLHQLITDGAKRYTKESIKNPAEITICVGSGDTTKSGGFLTKMVDCMSEFATNTNLGVWGDPADADYCQNPFYKDMSGTIAPGNNKSGGWRHEYKAHEGGRWVKKGTKSAVYHVSYSSKKRTGAEAAAGGRYALSVVEEVGLCLGKDTMIRMFDGTVKAVQDILPQDEVMGHDGKMVQVDTITSGVCDLYKVKQTFGKDYVVNKNHKICLRHDSEDKLVIAKHWNEKEHSPYQGYKGDQTETEVKVVKEGKGKYYGFTLKESPYFLLADGTVCHNTDNIREVYGSNQATVKFDVTSQFGVQAMLGTSGNMETIIGAKEIFLNPSQYNLINYPDIWSGSGKQIGFFLPAYITTLEHKDENGNTDFKAAKKAIRDLENKIKESSNPLALRIHRMNYPVKPSDMWVDKKGSILPSEFAEEIVERLEKNDQYKRLGTPVKLTWNNDNVEYQLDMQAEPFYETKGFGQRASLEGSVMIYEPPIHNNNSLIPPDMYNLIGHDPYVSDNVEDGGSLGATHVVMNPKYWDKHLKKSPLVATYIGKPYGGKEEYYNIQEKLMALYGNPTRGLWYEANRGQFCRDYYLRKRKTHLLAVRPQRVVGSTVQQKKITQYGWIVGNKIAKIQILELLRDWLLEDIIVGNKKMKIIESLPCMLTLRQIAAFDLENGNFDAIMSFAGAIIGLRENEHFSEDMAIHKTKNMLSFISTHRRQKRR